MSFVAAYLPEFDQEMAQTRRILELVPDRLLGWQAHEQLNSIGWVASHIADTLSWVEVTLHESSFDVAPPGEPPHKSPVLGSQDEILQAFDRNVGAARSLIAAATDEQLQEPWTLLQGGQELFTMPRQSVLKMYFINHVIHHRAFLIAYLRMNDVDCPGVYG